MLRTGARQLPGLRRVVRFSRGRALRPKMLSRPRGPTERGERGRGWGGAPVALGGRSVAGHRAEAARKDDNRRLLPSAERDGGRGEGPAGAE